MALAYIIELFPFWGLWNFDEGFFISTNNFFSPYLLHKSKIFAESKAWIKSRRICDVLLITHHS